MVVPETKLVITKSSIERQKASSAAAMMPGKMSGKVTRQKVVHSLAPRSMAASSRCRSKPEEARLHGDHDVADVEHDVGDEDGREAGRVEGRHDACERLQAVATKIVSRLAPRTTSGVAMGRKIRMLMAPRPRKE